MICCHTLFKKLKDKSELENYTSIERCKMYSFNNLLNLPLYFCLKFSRVWFMPVHAKTLTISELLVTQKQSTAKEKKNLRNHADCYITCLHNNFDLKTCLGKRNDLIL